MLGFIPNRLSEVRLLSSHITSLVWCVLGVIQILRTLAQNRQFILNVKLTTTWQAKKWYQNYSYNDPQQSEDGLVWVEGSRITQSGDRFDMYRVQWVNGEIVKSCSTSFSGVIQKKIRAGLLSKPNTIIVTFSSRSDTFMASFINHWI